MAGASAVYFLDAKGKVLISRNYRGDVPQAVAEKFIARMLEEEDLNLKPVIVEDGVTFFYIKCSNLFLLATSNRNANASLVLTFLYRLVNVLEEYFKTLEEESLRDNFVIVYELLDEVMDFGYPQSTEAKILQEYITQESNQLERAAATLPPALTNAVSWRSENIKYKKNEVFLDVVESVNLLVNTNGTLLKSEIVGSVKMKSFLSGMPELRLGLNDKLMLDNSTRGAAAGGAARSKSIEMEDMNFHQCVRLSRFETDKTISFIPPDGEFELMSYRLSTHIKPLIWIEAVIEPHANSRIEYMIKARSQYKARSVANNVNIIIPVPQDADTPKFKASMGKCEYKPEKDAIVWSINKFPGQKEFMLRAHFGLPSIHNEEQAQARAPITLSFEIPYFTVSGIQVRYLKIIERSGYQALPWVRYITQSGDYQVRV